MKYFYLLFLVLTAQLSFSQIRFQNIPEGAQYPERNITQTLTANIDFQGYDETQSYFGQGEYEIFLDNYNGVLNKPIIVLDGFDPRDSRGIGDIYAGLSFGGQNFANILRDEGFDIVILNAPVYTSDGKLIDGGADYIQRNAMVLIALIQQLNADKVGENELVILGPSMGGLIARYALAYMEENNLETETRLYISFDSPHRGANIPISLQYLINYFASSPTIAEPSAQQIVDQVLNSPAAKEMLVDHFSSHILEGSTYLQDPTKLLPEGALGFRNEFQAELDDLGFPSNTRNITMINGSGNVTTTGSPGMTIIDANLGGIPFSTMDVALKFTPEAGQTNDATDTKLYVFGVEAESYHANSQALTTTDGVDSSPGGTGSVSDALGDGGGNEFLINFLNALQQDLYSFIPTMSALAIDNPDWFAMPNLSDSPFEAFSIPNENEPHVTMTATNVQFALDEIRAGVVGISENQFGSGFVLAQNPVKSTINIAVMGNSSVEKMTTTVYSITGQRLMEQTWSNPQHEIVWNHNLAGGIYLLKLDNGNSVQTIKMLVE